MNMKHTKLMPIAFLLLSFSGLSCEKNTNENVVYTGTIFYVGCQNVGIDINGSTGYGKGVKWDTHTNAATIANKCLLDNLNIKAGDKISFKISDTNIEPGTNCYFASCFAIDNLPASLIYVYNVTKVN